MGTKLVVAGEWVKVRPRLNKQWPATGLCRDCKRASMAPGWHSIRSGEFLCKKCFDKELARQTQKEIDDELAELARPRPKRRAADV